MTDKNENELMKRDDTVTNRSVTTQDEKPWGIDRHTYCILMHIAQLAGFILPFAGVILPLVMWLTNKDKFSDIDEHGKSIVNWVMSLLIYSMVAFVLAFVFIGFFFLLVLMVLNMVFAIVGAVKASEGKVWSYPLSIRFFK